MESGELLELSVGRDIEARRVLSLRSAEAFRNGISVVDSPMDEEGLLASLGRGQVVRHRLSGAWGRNMLEVQGQRRVQAEGEVCGVRTPGVGLMMTVGGSLELALPPLGLVAPKRSGVPLA